MKNETPKDFLNRLMATDISNDDDAIMEAVFKKVGFSDARVVVGVVYLFGKGEPTDIHSVAKSLLGAL